jgi:putative Holliday junction resolvase
VRYLSIDLGDQRTGLAAGDAITRIATPLTVLVVPIAERAGEALLDALARAVDDQLGPPSTRGELVIGLPFNMDGTEGPRAKLVRDFAARLAQRSSRAIHFQDERLTSAAADWSMARSGLTRRQKKDRRDARAAATLLQDFLNNLPVTGS